MRFYPLEKLINLHDGYTGQFKIDHRQILLMQRDNRCYALEARCPHRAHPLDTASISGELIQCPLHQYRFSLRDGSLIQATEEPCRALRTYELVYEGNEVGVMLEEDG
ncbi:Rieske (2Fe-2S) protein [Haliea sp. E17]|uniref:Rieske (2Fe-2S) protein n=1 Tax=Haliea sp. E17 TaxID=3401576 RepID=UPI003AAB8AA4